jgi:hypothetical protein
LVNIGGYPAKVRSILFTDIGVAAAKAALMLDAYGVLAVAGAHPAAAALT